MKFRIVFALLPFLAGQSLKAQDFDKATYYAVMAAGKLDSVDAELDLLAADSFPGKPAYEGALMMRKAGLVTGIGDKLRTFKAGRTELENAIAKDSANGEYHFMRLIIQEHAPGIVRYSGDIEKDGDLVRRTFPHLPPPAQKAIINYSKHSKTLHPEDFDPKKN
jgi:hypothetical protein